MNHATRASAPAGETQPVLAQAMNSVVVLAVFFGVLMLGGHFARVQASPTDEAVVSQELIQPVARVALSKRAKAEQAARKGLSDEMARVRDWVAERYRVAAEVIEPAFVEAELSAREAALDPLLIVAMMAVESSFNPKAKSHAGALGLMQVIPRWHMDKIGPDNDHTVLFDPRVNVQVGTLVLLEGMQRYGSLEAALQYYNGARNDPEKRYTKRVMSVKRQLQTVLAQASSDA